ncbi:MAG: methylated-DNA--protein-cysteine methyltransferase [Candidatus Binatia bacterium]|nr:MAG: methylated-DNA--protein-cysteine methyltransferase [Candidatus Binatia bacterium]
MPATRTAELTTPLGPLVAEWTERGVRTLFFRKKEATLSALEPRACANDPFGLQEAVEAYFRGDLAAFDHLPLDPGGTVFLRKAWLLMRSIPAGSTLSYGELARELGLPRGARAVGLAARKNPLVLAVPCHRVVATDGSLGGYAAGLWRKKWLLEHERRCSGQTTREPSRWENSRGK